MLNWNDRIICNVGLFISLRQLNATVQPVSCFDANLFKMLPSELIVFGKLVNGEGDRRPGSEWSASPFQDTAEATADTLKISVNGLHRWTPHLEHYIWKHLGKWIECLCKKT